MMDKITRECGERKICCNFYLVKSGDQDDDDNDLLIFLRTAWMSRIITATRNVKTFLVVSSMANHKSFPAAHPSHYVKSSIYKEILDPWWKGKPLYSIIIMFCGRITERIANIAHTTDRSHSPFLLVLSYSLHANIPVHVTYTTADIITLKSQFMFFPTTLTTAHTTTDYIWKW